MTIPPPLGDSRRLPPDDLLFRYLAGTLPPESADAVRELLDAVGVPDGAVAGMRDALMADAVARGALARSDAADLQASLQRLLARLDRSDVVPLARPNYGARTPMWWGGVAALGACVALGFVLLRQHVMPSSTHALEQGGRQYTTGRGQRATLTLDDGSRVTLAPQTMLRVANGFGGATREVSLRGEATFEVLSRDGAPFVVRTGQVSTRVLGTVFDVRRYDNDATTQVAVTSGRVAMSSGLSPARVVVAGSIGSSADSAVVVNVAAESSASTTWSNDILVFRHVPAADVLTTLSRWYDYDFRVVDSAVMAQNITAQFNVQSPREALATLRVVFDVDLSFDGKVVTLTPRRTSRAVDSSRRRDPARTLTTEVGR